MKKSHAKGSPPPSERDESPPAYPSRRAIADRAYELYVARGRADGNDLDDWLQAECDLRSRAVSTASES